MARRKFSAASQAGSGGELRDVGDAVHLAGADPRAARGGSGAAPDPRTITITESKNASTGALSTAKVFR